MALDRTWFNALVDDNGDGLSGSVWDKADIKNLLDSVDSEIARLDGKISANIFTPSLLSDGGGTPIYSVRAGRYTKNGTQIAVAGRIVISSKGSLGTGGLYIGGFPFPSTSWTQQSGFTFGLFSGITIAVSGLGAYMDASSVSAHITYVVGAGAGAISFLTVAEINPAVDLIFSGSYQID